MWIRLGSIVTNKFRFTFLGGGRSFRSVGKTLWVVKKSLPGGQFRKAMQRYYNFLTCANYCIIFTNFDTVLLNNSSFAEFEETFFGGGDVC